MKILIVGATGKTGLRLITQLLAEGHSVTAIVRTAEKLPQNIRNHENLSITTSIILDMSHENAMQHVENCDVIVSCLGHTMDFRGPLVGLNKEPSQRTFIS